jgi:hypothetical protein
MLLNKRGRFLKNNQHERIVKPIEYVLEIE